MRLYLAFRSGPIFGTLPNNWLKTGARKPLAAQPEPYPGSL